MKRIKRELAHTGMFGADGTTVTKKDLAEIAEQFDGKAPVTLGHQLADWMPKFGNVAGVSLTPDGEHLNGELDINDLLADAVDEKFYGDLSIGAPIMKSSGKRYLHHVAFLGAVPPKIRDLKEFADLGVVFCGDDKNVVEFADQIPSPAPGSTPPSPASTDDRAAAATKIMDAKQRAAWGMDDVRNVVDNLAAWATEMALSGAIPDDLRNQTQQLADQFPRSPAAEKGKEDEVEKIENDKLRKELADSNAIIKSQAIAGLTTAMDGKVPKDKQGLVLSLADLLATDETIPTIELADSEGKKEKVNGFEILRRIFDSIPKPVKEGALDLGDPENTKGDKKPILASIKGKF